MRGLITSNSLIKQVEAQVEQRLKAGVRESYMKIVVSGMKYALDKGPNGIMASIGKSQDPIPDIVKGAIGILGLLRRAAKGVMPIDAMIPAGLVLVLQGLDYAERAKVLTVDKATIDQATHLYIETIMTSLGLTNEKMSKLAGQVTGVMNDKDKAQQLYQPQQPTPQGAPQ